MYPFSSRRRKTSCVTLAWFSVIVAGDPVVAGEDVSGQIGAAQVPEMERSRRIGPAHRNQYPTTHPPEGKRQFEPEVLSFISVTNALEFHKPGAGHGEPERV